MKWIYVPLMFALAIAHTKISFNKSTPQITKGVASLPIGRSPASVEEINPSSTEIKRVTSQVLFKNLSDSNFVLPFQEVAKFQGIIIGNPHIESFGFIIDDRSKSEFTISEFQDVGVGAYYKDVLAHLVSTKSQEKKISWINYFDAYKSGIQGQPHVFSYYVDRGLEDAVWLNQVFFENNVTKESPFEFTKLKKTHSKISLTKKALLIEALKKKFSKMQYYDFLVEKSDIEKYQILVRIRPQDKIQWLELFENGQNANEVFFNSDLKPIGASEKIEILKKSVLEGKFDRSLGTIVFDKKEYVMKFSDNFSAKFLLREIPSDDYYDIFLDEAYVLGKIHKKSLDDKSDEYLKAWATIPAAAIDEKMIELKYRLKDLQE